MNPLLRRSVALAACATLVFGPIMLVGESEALASDSPRTGFDLSPAAPAGTTVPTPPTPFALTVSPTRLVVAPGDIAAPQLVQVANSGTSPVTVTVQKRNFVARADGTLDYQQDAPYAAADWVAVDNQNFELAPGATHTVTAALTVPPDPETGDHQVALVFLVPAAQTSDNVKINRGIAIPMFITVPGPIDDSASLTDLDAGGFAIGGPIDVTAKVHNDGTVHRDFRGATPLQVGGAGTAAPFPDFTVLRGATRDISTTWEPPLLCICHPSVSFVNADGSVQAMRVQVIVFPLPLAGALLVAAAVLVIGFRLARRRYQFNVRTAAAALNGPVGVGDA